ncbi:hypothetical protein H2201_007787 [Coniosporium apollinis]|uniref:RING-type domain-containing protein n=1 Tax=Coniosporium apollinis TaxID=61459 RepID=A0ABQ9NJZ5_9PEZI|nr:hypothetical protein H2201_007787 [Coniosporium apollinis]
MRFRQPPTIAFVLTSGIIIMNGQAGFHHLVELTGIHNQTQAHALAAAEAGLEQCILCLDEMPIKDLVATRCPLHRMCKPCLTARLNRALKYEIDHPVYCCFPQYAIRIDDVKEHFPPEFIQEYKAKTAEYNTAPRNRVYCATPRCSAFLQESAAVDAAGKDSDVLT